MAQTKQPKVYANARTPWIRAIVSRKMGALAAHWVFQGMLYMDPTERAFKLALDGALWLALGGLLALVLPLWWAAALGAVAAHTVNVLVNGQVYAVLKHFGGVRHSWDQVEAELVRFRRRAAETPCLTHAFAYGSLAREMWKPTSDLDLMVVRAPGLRCGVAASVFALRERARAFWRGFPLDMFVLDDVAHLDKVAERGRLIVLKGASKNDAAA